MLIDTYPVEPQEGPRSSQEVHNPLQLTRRGKVTATAFAAILAAGVVAGTKEVADHESERPLPQVCIKDNGELIIDSADPTLWDAAGQAYPGMDRQEGIARLEHDNEGVTPTTLRPSMLLHVECPPQS